MGKSMFFTKLFSKGRVTTGGGGGTVTSVTGLNTNNSDPANPVVQISVDGLSITGAGTPGSPLYAGLYTDISWTEAVSHQNAGDWPHGWYRIVDVGATVPNGFNLIYFYTRTFVNKTGRSLVHETGHANMYDYQGQEMYVVISVDLINSYIKSIYDPQKDVKLSSSLSVPADFSTMIPWGNSNWLALDLVDPTITLDTTPDNTTCYINEVKGSCFDTFTFSVDQQGISGLNGGADRTITFSANSSIFLASCNIPTGRTLYVINSWSQIGWGNVSNYYFNNSNDSQLDGGFHLTVFDGIGVLRHDGNANPTMKGFTQSGVLDGDEIYIRCLESGGGSISFSDDRTSFNGLVLIAGGGGATINANGIDYAIFRYETNNAYNGLWVEKEIKNF